MAKFGRPPKYDNNSAIREVAAYINDCKKNNYLPTCEGLAVHLEISRQTVYQWRKDHDDFSYIVEQMLAGQAAQLIQNGLVGHYNSTITKLLLTKHRGADNLPYKDKSDVTTDDKPLTEIRVTFEE